MKNIYTKPELLMTLIDVLDIITISGDNVDNQPDNDQGGNDLELWPD